MTCFKKHPRRESRDTGSGSNSTTTTSAGNLRTFPTIRRTSLAMEPMVSVIETISSSNVMQFLDLGLHVFSTRASCGWTYLSKSVLDTPCVRGSSVMSPTGILTEEKPGGQWVAGHFDKNDLSPQSYTTCSTRFYGGGTWGLVLSIEINARTMSLSSATAR
ncbi:hypothetical protein Tco_0098971 [Tanacetum coccineum]